MSLLNVVRRALPAFAVAGTLACAFAGTTAAQSGLMELVALGAQDVYLVPPTTGPSVEIVAGPDGAMVAVDTGEGIVSPNP
ncbi:MAG: hypothetical protein KC442_13530 [Thermomicrobiales bacterium]|nr:hypothetical protein [Thermomicrobiales bacterium]